MQGVGVGAKYFNDRLQEKFYAFKETGDFEEMSVHAFVARGDQIIFNLKERVKQFLEDGKTPGFAQSNKQKGQGLLADYGTLIGLMTRIKEFALDFTEKLKTYNKESDKTVNASFAVMNFADAERITAQFNKFVADVEYKFMTAGSVRTYLPDRITDLKKLLEVKK